MTVSELLSRVSSRELSEWMAFYDLEPFGWEAGLFGHAVTSSTVMNAHRSRKSDHVFKPEEFMPKKQAGRDFFKSLKKFFVREGNGEHSEPSGKA